LIDLIEMMRILVDWVACAHRRPTALFFSKAAMEGHKHQGFMTSVPIFMPEGERKGTITDSGKW